VEVSAAVPELEDQLRHAPAGNLTIVMILVVAYPVMMVAVMEGVPIVIRYMFLQQQRTPISVVQLQYLHVLVVVQVPLRGRGGRN